MFSGRTSWKREESAVARAERTARRSARFLDLTLSNPTRANLPTPAVEADLGASLVYEPAPFGLQAARESIAGYYTRRGVPVDPDRVLVVSSTSEAYTALLRLLCDSEDAVLAPEPSYPLISLLAGLSDVAVESYPLELTETGWHMSLRDPGARARAILSVSPNNPTGSHPSPGERARMLKLARDRELAIVSDEVFLDFLDRPEDFARVSFAAEPSTLAFSLSGLSKVAGLPQLKLSWIVASGPSGLVAEASARLEIVLDSFLSASAGVQVALPEILAQAEPYQATLRARIRRNLDVLTSAGSRAPWRVLPRAGGWYAVLELPEGRDDERWAVALLERESVLTHPGYLFDFPSERFVVLSLIVPPDAFEEGVERILRADP